MFEEEIKFLEKTIKKAYKKCIKNRTRNVEIKNNDMYVCDYVTNCDLATEKYITQQIKNKYPTDTMVSEEFNSKNKLEGRCWVLDPIDGTVCFSNNIPIWCIQSAFVVDGEIKGAVIYCPELKEMYVADENGLKINGKKITLNSNKPINQSIVNVSDLAQKSEETYNLQLKTINEMGKQVHKVKMFGSAGYEFCMVASGRIQAYAIFWNNIWDVFPGAFICEKVGINLLETKTKDSKVTVACTNNLVEPFKKVINFK